MTTTTVIQFDPLPMLDDQTAWLCPECEEIAMEEPDSDKLYECNECSQKFVGSNGGGKNGNMCPDCGNKFGTRIDEGDKQAGATICPSCQEAVAEEIELATCPFCDWHCNVGEIDTDEYVKHVWEDHTDEMSYKVVVVETPQVPA